MSQTCYYGDAIRERIRQAVKLACAENVFTHAKSVSE
jgi:hypothetical protein